MCDKPSALVCLSHDTLDGNYTASDRYSPCGRPTTPRSVNQPARSGKSFSSTRLLQKGSREKHAATGWRWWNDIITVCPPQSPCSARGCVGKFLGTTRESHSGRQFMCMKLRFRSVLSAVVGSQPGTMKKSCGKVKLFYRAFRSQFASHVLRSTRLPCLSVEHLSIRCLRHSNRR